MTKQIWFDMDGTIANLYAVDGWLEDIRAENTRPYSEAKPMLNLSLLARLLNRVQREGWEIGIVSWGAKNSTEKFLKMTGCAKFYWLQNHLPSVNWNHIYIDYYGTNKFQRCGCSGILFDDEEQNRNDWENGFAYEPKYIIDTLKDILAHTTR